MKAQDDFTKNQDKGNDNMLPPFPESGYRNVGINPGHAENKQLPGYNEYQYPLKCEGEKTNDIPEKCLHFKMDLDPAGRGHIFY